MTAPNIVNVTTIIGKSNVFSLTTTPSNVVINSAASGKVVKLNTVIISNNNQSGAANVNVEFYRNSLSWYIANSVSVPAGSSVVVLDKRSSIYLEEGDTVRVYANVASYLWSVCSYEEIS